MFILITFVRTNGQTVGQTKNDLEKQLVDNTNNSQEKVSSVRTNGQTNGQTVGQTKNDLEKQLVENTNNSQEKVSSVQTNVHTNNELKKQVSPIVPENTQRTIVVHD